MLGSEDRQAAKAFSRELDEAMASPGWVEQTEPGSLLRTAGRLAELPRRLGPASPELESRVLSGVLSKDIAARSMGRGWRAFAAVAAALLAVAIWFGLTPSGHSVMASFAARFGLGQFEVQVTPEPGGAGDSYVVSSREVLTTLADAAALVDHQLLVPKRLPDGYKLKMISAVTYENMPVWIPQPFYVDLEYGAGASDELYDLTIREFALSMQEGDYTRRIKEVSFSSGDVSGARNVSVAGIPGVMLNVHVASSVPPLKRLVWQHDQVIVEMLSQTMTDEQLLETAASLAPAQ